MRGPAGEGAPETGPGITGRGGEAGGRGGAGRVQGEGGGQRFQASAGGSFDVLTLAVALRRIEQSARPLRDALEVVKHIVRWRTPVVSVFCCLVLNLFILALSHGAWLALATLLLTVPATLGYAQERCRPRLPEEQLMVQRRHSVWKEDLSRITLSRHEALAETKHFLIQLQHMLTRACDLCEIFYGIISWESQALSVRFYGCLLAALYTFYFLPLHWMILLVVNITFFWNQDFLIVMSEWWRNRKQQRRQQQQQQQQQVQQQQQQQEEELGPPLSPVEVTVTEPNEAEEEAVAPDSYGSEGLMEDPVKYFSHESLQPSTDDSEEQSLEDEFKDAIEERMLPVLGDEDSHSSSGDQDMVPLDNGGPPARIPEPIRYKVASKLAELKRRHYPTSTSGTCTSCSNNFSVLKKRRSCSNCGNGFCTRCLNYRVTKSAMGATAPDAQKETVQVCYTCYGRLNKY
ncbi:protrudin isoform X1 [Lethenteron reissneri]|uniref:protrudin isoform X1 n=1 Tax=Lethenteron reissneri TaxID=7753 RepID=UPI002AB795ED|nr:protrudin isoform X1 [Lethenteron reissneri]